MEEKELAGLETKTLGLNPSPHGPVKPKRKAQKDFTSLSYLRFQQRKLKKEILEDIQSIDETKVQHFQKLIDKGNYHVDAKELAHCILLDHSL